MRLLGAVVTCAMLLFARPTCHQASRDARLTEKSKQELLDLENHWLQVENDPNALESILASDFLHVMPMGIITKEEQLNFMRKHPAPQQRSERHFEDMHVRVYGSVGIVNGMVVEIRTARRRTLFTDVFAHREGCTHRLPVAKNYLPQRRRARADLG